MNHHYMVACIFMCVIISYHKPVKSASQESVHTLIMPLNYANDQDNQLCTAQVNSSQVCFVIKNFLMSMHCSLLINSLLMYLSVFTYHVSYLSLYYLSHPAPHLLIKVCQCLLRLSINYPWLSHISDQLLLC